MFPPWYLLTLVVVVVSVEAIDRFGSQHFVDTILRQLTPGDGNNNTLRGPRRITGVGLPNRNYLFTSKEHHQLLRKTIEIDSIESGAKELALSLRYLSSLDRHTDNKKEQVRQHLSTLFTSFGLKVARQSFYEPTHKLDGSNIIGLRIGRRRRRAQSGRLLRDRILVIGAHYDTVAETPGLNDNASGLAVLIELMRLLDQHQCETEFTILFVAFDLEELGGIGSKYFVHEYLIPAELVNGMGNRFKGAIILDTLLNFDGTPGSQDIPNDIHLNIPQFSQMIKVQNYTGDFLAMFARTGADQVLSDQIQRSWQQLKSVGANTTKSYRLNEIRIQTLGTRKTTTSEDLYNHVNMLRSDHVHFWYHNHSAYEQTLNAVLLTDTGPFRGYMRKCYHKACDDVRHLSDDNLNFLKTTVDVLLRSILDLVEGTCFVGEAHVTSRSVIVRLRDRGQSRPGRRLPQLSRATCALPKQTFDKIEQLLRVSSGKSAKDTVWIVEKFQKMLATTASASSPPPSIALQQWALSPSRASLGRLCCGVYRYLQHLSQLISLAWFVLWQ